MKTTETSPLPEVDPAQQPLNENATLETKLAEMEDKYLRAVAEAENFRRIADRERKDAARFGSSDLAADLLDSIDNLERAIASAESGGKLDLLLNGLVATRRGLLATLARHGVTRVDPLGEPFNPDRHHAMYERPDQASEVGTVVEVLQPGYIINGRLLRPAMVGVASDAPILAIDH